METIVHKSSPVFVSTGHTCTKMMPQMAAQIEVNEWIDIAPATETIFH